MTLDLLLLYIIVEWTLDPLDLGYKIQHLLYIAVEWTLDPLDLGYKIQHLLCIIVECIQRLLCIIVEISNVCYALLWNGHSIH